MALTRVTRSKNALMSGLQGCRFLATKAKNPYAVIDDPQAETRSRVVSRNSLSSVSDPVADYQSKPYERPQQIRRERLMKAQILNMTSLSSFSDPAYDYMQQTYEKQNSKGQGSFTAPPSLTKANQGGL